MNITTVHQPNIEDYDDFDIQVNAYDGKDWLIRFFFDKEHGKWSEPTYIYSVADNESPFENEMKEEYVPQERYVMPSRNRCESLFKRVGLNGGLFPQNERTNTCTKKTREDKQLTRKSS